ncbi:MAG: right-handed parallel beta-helix repeat-containing protein [Armatimonadia bacterium]
MHRLTILLVTLLAVTLATAAPLSLYVAPAGNDTWSGRLPAANATRTDGPFSTITRARDELRQLRAEGKLPDGAKVILRAGTCHLTEHLVFGPQDSGTERTPITYLPFRGEIVSLKGSVPVTGWQPYRDRIYQAPVLDAALAGGRFWQLYYRGTRQALARYPNFDPKHPRSGGFVYVAGVVEKGSKTLLQYNPERLDPARWSHPEEVRVHIWSWLNWNRNIVPIKQVDRDRKVIEFAQPASYMISQGNRFFVENSLEELDAPGEWYLDPRTRTLYFWPPDNTDPGDGVSVPVLPDLIRVQGQAPDRFVSQLRFERLSLCETRQGLVRMSRADHCTLAASTLTGCGGNAVVFDTASHHNRITGCDVAHVGGTAITLSDERDWTHKPEGHVAYNVIDNNHVHDVGEYGDAWGAIRVDPGCGGNASHDNVISHNLVHDTPRQGISFNGMSNIVEYNHVHHTNQEQSDTGAIGMGSRDIYERGSIIRYNYVHDTGGYNMLKPGVWEYPHYCWGIYLDDYTSGVHVYGNLIVRAQRGGVMVHGGQDNLIENNIIVDSSGQQIEYAPIDSLTTGRTPGHPDTGEWLMKGTRALRNIIYYTDPKAQYVRGSKWQQMLAESNFNLIWHAGLPIAMNLAGVEDGNYWAAWQKLGFGLNSVIADPRFVDAKRDNYRIRPGSPALRLGFKPLPYEKMGLYKSPDRASWPVADDQWREEHLRFPDGEPTTTAPAKRTQIPVVKALRRAAAPIIDGRVDAPEWDWNPANTATVAALSMDTGNGKQPSRAVVTWDAEALYVALVNEVTDSTKLVKTGGTWGADDGAELCLQDTSEAKPGPTFVLQGFPSGKHQSVDHAGAPAEAVRRAGQAVTYAATIGQNQWSGEWKIPFAALNIDPAKATNLLFNIGVLKAQEREWIAWVSTGGAPWHMDLAGKLLLVP